MSNRGSQAELFEPPLPDQIAIRPVDLFGRFRPVAIDLVIGDRPIHIVLDQPDILEMLLVALPGLEGEDIKVIAARAPEVLRVAVEAIVPLTPEELDAIFPVLVGIAETLGLTHEEKLILAFLVHTQDERFWKEWILYMGKEPKRRHMVNLSRLLGLEATKAMHAIEPGGGLLTSGLLGIPHHVNVSVLNDCIRPLADLDTRMLQSPDAWDDFFLTRFGISEPASSSFDFSFMEQDMRLVTDCLRHALASRQQGIHVLLYGVPGTGKTTLTHEIAAALQVSLFEVCKELSAGGYTDGERRFNNYLLGQRLGSADHQYLMLFDELEDLLPAVGQSTVDRRLHKGMICDVLENSRIPTLWTSNSLRGIDPAILRRFTFTLEVGVPPRSFRRKLLDQLLPEQGLSENWREHVAGLDCLTPAMTTQLGMLSESLAFDGLKLESFLTRWLNDRLRAMGKPPMKRLCDGPSFRCDLMNVDENLENIVEGLRTFGEGRLCLHGPPGTGKSAFARHIANQLERSAMIRMGSSLRSAYVGETERNVAQMFSQAVRENAVLILDEADTFLSQRAGRHESWAVNEASEFLVQLESFQGIFIATTNRFEDLDPAFMRRFDLKIRIEYLNNSQKFRFFGELLDLGGDFVFDPVVYDRLSAMDSLTPGDFIAATRRLKFSGRALTEKALLSALVHELECKQVNKGRPIGFQWAD